MTAPSTTNEAQAKYDKLAARKGELRAELGAVNNEISTILEGLGELAASGASYSDQTARLAVLRQRLEALELAVQYVSGQSDLLQRSHYGLSRR